MILEFVGGSRDGEIIEVDEESAEAFLMPVIMEPMPPMITIEEAKVLRPACEVYCQREPGKLLFEGWSE
jgi:hypothetical protein